MFEFTQEELDYMNGILDERRSALSIFFQEGTLKGIETWKEEVAVNGVKKTLLHFEKYIESFNDAIEVQEKV